MTKESIIHNIRDWSALNMKEEIWSKVDLSEPEVNFGIHKYQGNLWSGGYVGVGRIYGRNRKPIQSAGKEHVIVSKPRYDVDPWKMLETVMADDEYDGYVKELAAEGKYLFRIFYDQALIRLAQGEQGDNDILYALSYVTACHELCRKGLKKTLFHQEKNYSSKIRGRIDVMKNIKFNTCRGRGDRFYCKYIDFTEDNTENRILKATLIKCKAILEKRFAEDCEIYRRIAFCMNAMRSVKSVRIKTGDFNNASVAGLYMYYKPALEQARCIYNQKYYTYISESGKPLMRSVFTIPYRINMESLFEFYARTILKRAVDPKKHVVESYSRKLFLQRGVTRVEEAARNIHLMAYCIPDIIICRAADKKPVCVIDAKYKPYAHGARADSHQLLSYVLLTGAERCGFVFPGAVTEVRRLNPEGREYLPLNVKNLRYYELLLGNEFEKDEIMKILD